MKNPIGYEILSISDGILTYIDYLSLTFPEVIFLISGFLLYDKKTTIIAYLSLQVVDYLMIQIRFELKILQFHLPTVQGG